MFQGINWPEIVVGFALGLLPGLYKVIINIWKYFFNKSKLIGTFNWYHLSGTQVGVVRKKTLIIRRSFKGYLEVIIPVSEYTGLSFTGRVLNSDLAIIYISAKGDDHKERVFMTINIPVNRNYDLLTGTFSGISLKNNPMSGLMILSKSDLPEDNVAEYLGGDNIYARFTVSLKK